MAKFTLTLEDDFDFFLCAICSHSRDYRLSWYLNEALDISLSKQDDLEMKSKEEVYGFSFYLFEDERLEYYLVGNKCLNTRLIPEEKQADYFLKIKGPVEADKLKDVVEKVNNIPVVLKSYALDVNELKSRKNLIF